jgi:hypothetical protein
LRIISDLKKNFGNNLGANSLDTLYGREQLNNSFQMINPKNYAQYGGESYESFNYLNYENGNANNYSGTLHPLSNFMTCVCVCLSAR